MTNKEYLESMTEKEWKEYCKQWKHISGIPMDKIKYIMASLSIPDGNGETQGDWIYKNRATIKKYDLKMDGEPISKILRFIEWLGRQSEEEPKKIKVYIAGPITDNPFYKINFSEVEERLLSLGFEPINPAKYSPPDMPYKYYITRGIIMLSGCDKIYMLKGWQRSPGATLEKHFAETVGIEVMPWTR